MKSIFIPDIRLHRYILFPFIILFIVSCGKSSSSENIQNSSAANTNSSENKISSDLLKKIQTHQLTSTRGYKVAIKIKDGEDISDVLNSGDVRYKANNLVNAVFVDLDRESVLNLAKDQRVEKIEENYDVKVNLFYATKHIGIRDSWVAGYNGTTLGNTGNPSDKIRLAVVDTGIDDRHSDFCNDSPSYPPSSTPCSNSKIVKMVNCYQVPTCVEGSAIDDHGHGSHVSGIILGNGASCDESNDTASIELHGNLTSASSAIRYFFPAQFESIPGGDISIDMTWTSSTATQATVALQSKSDAEVL
ncbi:MAG: S8 family serine peptidase, partial [Proteobacteria bacterium]|nr:S8 family serine peptidase [Pseudomonadota bacterium]